MEKLTLSMAELEAQTAFELPDRQLMDVSQSITIGQANLCDVGNTGVSGGDTCNQANLAFALNANHVGELELDFGG
jgi:hypothetical protein